MFALFSKQVWDDPDWRVRQKAALTKKDQVQLRRLALTDTSEEVRLAAVKSLEDPGALVEVAQSGLCAPSRQLAVSRIADPGHRLALVLDRTLPDELRVSALNGLRADERLLAAYRPEAAEPLKLALLGAVGDVVNDVFWATAARSDPSRKVRELAIGRIKSEKVCLNLARGEPDFELRRLLSDGIQSAELLYQLLECETKETQRMWLASRIREPAILDRIVRNDRNIDVRLAALIRIEPVPMIVGIACANLPKQVAMAALARLYEDESRGTVAMRSPHEEIRAEALRPISDEDVLSRLEEEAPQPEIRWLAGRRIGSMPIKALAEIRHGPTLRRLIEQEAEPEVATWLVGRVGDQETLRVLGGSTFPGVAAAQRRLSERVGPLGLRFMNVPGRPYEMSLFPVTIGQLREALGPAVAGKGADDLPAAGITPEVARQFCEFLSTKEGRTYRLPSFEEWRHACMAGDENWLDAATGQFSWAEALLGTQRMAFGCKGRRAALLAWANPWGFLDMVGNVAVWVDDSPRHWLHLASGDPLAVGGDPSDDSDFALAAGVSWADTRVQKGQLERLVARSALSSGWATDKVGFRVVCDQEKAMPSTTKYKLVLLPETAPGISKDIVVAAMGSRWAAATDRLATWYRVAPAVVLLTPQYSEARQVKRLLESCGARTQLTTETVGGTVPPFSGTR